MKTHDYVIQVWKDGRMFDETLLTDCERETLDNELEIARANYPGCETRVYTCNADMQGGTVNVSNLRRI